MEERKLPISIQSFEDLRKNDYLYVDKTEYIWTLVNTGKSYFLSRPRRFGKSLLTTTIAAYFEGKKELFKGLAIEKHENEKGKEAWQQYPVIYFALASGEYNIENGLYDILNLLLEGYAKQYKFNLTGETLPVKFRSLIKGIYEKTGKQVVVLVDEYDKPLIDTMEVNPEQEEKNRNLYKSFFSVLKDEDVYLKFVFFTGVTKFSKVSIFSDLNQLKDISFSNRYACICGITEEELKNNFEPEVREMAEANGQSEEECLKELARMYDGYHFSKKSEGVYNPFSLLNAFDNQDYGRYWFGTGTPTFLIHKLKGSSFSAEQFVNGVRATEDSLMNYRPDNPDPIPLFYQSGYLTICGWYKDYRVYEMKFPNDEVEYGFLNFLIADIAPKTENRNGSFVMDYVEDLKKGSIDSFLTRMRSLFAGIPYIEGSRHLYEQEWRNEMYLVLAMLGQNVKCEVHTAEGRADCIVETEKYVYVFEFKLDQSAEEALKQIDEKGYAELYKAGERTVYEIGVNFSSEGRNIDAWKMKQSQTDTEKKE